MKKISIIIILCLAVCLGAVVFTGCNPSFGPVGTMEFKDSPVENNGGLVVKQGGYIYYVNGMDATSTITKPEDNAFGKASVKGSIMKSRIDENGNLSETAVVVPKMFYTSASNGGFYIYGEWIYYLSPNTKADNKSNVLSSQSVAFRTKIDGSKTQEIATLESNSTQYTFTDSAFVYYESNTLKKVSYTNDKVNKKAENIAEDVTATLFTTKSNVVFFLKSTDSKVRLNNLMYVYANGEAKELVNDNTYDSEGNLSADNLRKQYTFSLIAFDAKENTLFYSKVNNSNDGAKKTSTYAYKFGESYTFDITKEVRYATSSLTGSSIINLGGDNGILYTSAAGLEIYKPISESAIKNDTQKVVELNATLTEVVKIDGNDMYYITSNTLYKIDYTDKKAVPQKLSNDAIHTSWLNRSVIGDYLYYIDNTYNYMYRVNLKAFVGEDNNFKFAEGTVVSGTRKATLTKDKDGKITVQYVAEDANEENVKYYQIPKFMTSDDAQKYAEAIYEEEDK